MNRRENLLSRWSRLKRSAGPAKEKEGRLTFDLASLPSIDSITTGTDVSAFLQSGVPAHLVKAALSRAWVTEPLIRDFIGIAENQWDFTNPATIPGFGPLRAAQNELSLIARAEDMLGGASALLGSAVNQLHDGAFHESSEP